MLRKSLMIALVFTAGLIFPVEADEYSYIGNTLQYESPVPEHYSVQTSLEIAIDVPGNTSSYTGTLTSADWTGFISGPNGLGGVAGSITLDDGVIAEWTLMGYRESSTNGGDNVETFIPANNALGYAVAFGSAAPGTWRDSSPRETPLPSGLYQFAGGVGVFAALLVWSRSKKRKSSASAIQQLNCALL